MYRRTRHLLIVLPGLGLTLALMACGLGGFASAGATLASSALATVSAEPPSASTPSSSSSPAPSDLGTPDEAKAMLQKAIEHYNGVGRDQALADFTQRVDPFYYKDLYVACIDSTLKQSANGGFPELVGSSVQPLSRAIWDDATTTKVGSTSYVWIDPANGQSLPKTFYYEKVGSDVCGVGAYHP